MAYYKRLFGNDASRTEFLRDKSGLAYLKQINSMRDKISIGDIFNQKIPPHELSTFGMRGTTREFVIEGMYTNFVVAKAKKGGWRAAFTYQDLLDDKQFSWVSRRNG